MPADAEPYNNCGAVLHLTAPDYSTPAVESFEAVTPRLLVGGQEALRSLVASR
jgi:hypothetical protein